MAMFIKIKNCIFHRSQLLRVERAHTFCLRRPAINIGYLGSSRQGDNQLGYNGLEVTWTTIAFNDSGDRDRCYEKLSKMCKATIEDL